MPICWIIIFFLHIPAPFCPDKCCRHLANGSISLQFCHLLYMKFLLCFFFLLLLLLLFFIMIYCKLSNTYNTKEDSFYISCKGGWKPFRAYGSPLQCCRKCQNPESSIGLPMVVVWWSASVLGRPSIKDLLRPWNQLKMTNISAAANEESWVTQRTTQLMVYVGCSTQILGGPT